MRPRSYLPLVYLAHTSLLCRMGNEVTPGSSSGSASSFGAERVQKDVLVVDILCWTRRETNLNSRVRVLGSRFCQTILQPLQAHSPHRQLAGQIFRAQARQYYAPKDPDAVNQAQQNDSESKLSNISTESEASCATLVGPVRKVDALIYRGREEGPSSQIPACGETSRSSRLNSAVRSSSSEKSAMGERSGRRASVFGLVTARQPLSHCLCHCLCFCHWSFLNLHVRSFMICLHSALLQVATNLFSRLYRHTTVAALVVPLFCTLLARNLLLSTSLTIL